MSRPSCGQFQRPHPIRTYGRKRPTSNGAGRFIPLDAWLSNWDDVRVYNRALPPPRLRDCTTWPASSKVGSDPTIRALTPAEIKRLYNLYNMGR